MSTVAEIEAALPRLSTEELLRVERALHQQYRQRGNAIISGNSSHQAVAWSPLKKRRGTCQQREPCD